MMLVVCFQMLFDIAAAGLYVLEDMAQIQVMLEFLIMVLTRGTSSATASCSEDNSEKTL